MACELIEDKDALDEVRVAHLQRQGGREGRDGGRKEPMGERV